MRTFLIRLLIFSALFAGLVVIAAYKLAQPGEMDYVGGIVVKHKRLNEIKGPRLIFAGGSNMAFGLDSKAVEDSLKIPVVNLALHGGLGLDFMLEELKDVVRNGDVVILSPEYFLEAGRYELDAAVAAFMPASKKYFKHDFYTVFKYGVESRFTQIGYNRDYLMARWRKRNAPPERDYAAEVYSHKAFNSYGDVVAHLDLPSYGAPKVPLKLYAGYWDGIPKINAASRILAQRGVKFYFVFPAFCASSFNNNAATIANLEATLHRDLQIPVISGPQDFVYPDTLYYDSYYHLTKTGRNLRTQQLIKLVQPLTAQLHGEKMLLSNR
ncbi:hypothetical protein SAMN05444266_110157 [Chitinophaga jiangningensis]|uniref:Uncharacterized protein n=1 Tax=Chitinophaga jiangningensis TaxID=1419482 RepID=A0A1M7L7V8_9BACT|nr:hypothetical protein [Chitinophaga jiangningensis]SHM73469.1 hypothetical protein SAMN05444266_110157 [Chitinophaga jiangningensis]